MISEDCHRCFDCSRAMTQDDSSKSFQDLPLEIIEYIMSLVPPYQDLKNCTLVCKEWNRIVRDVVRRRQSHFSRCLKEMNLVWQEQRHTPGPTIAARYAHSACRYGNSMYIFGGCTAANTTFNDIWRFDLNGRTWIRPLVVGTYPPPKACATFLSYKNVLVLFGGVNHPHAYSVYQTSRLFNHVHFYGLLSNMWEEVPTSNPPPSIAGHSATIHKDLMIVFGGGQFSCGRFQYSSNEVWVLDLVTRCWWKQETTQPKPDPRFGQTQIRVDDGHILIIGGCGGPNKVISDMWLLSLMPGTEPWLWKKVIVGNNEHAANQIWCHPACKVGNKVMFLSKAPQNKTLLSYALGHMMCAPSRIWTPPPLQVINQGLAFRPLSAENRLQVDKINCNTQKCRTLGKTPTSQSATSSSNNVACCPCSSSSHSSNSPSSSSNQRLVGHESNDDKMVESSGLQNECSSSGGISSSNSASYSSCDNNVTVSGNEACSPSSRPRALIRNTPLPSIRPNSMKNRQRQLEGFQRMEERIKKLLRPNRESNDNHHVPQNGSAQNRLNNLNYVDNPMYIYVLDISSVLSSGEVYWLPLQEQKNTNGPEETTFYSLTYGRGELVMFGGIQKGHGTVEGLITEGRDVVSNRVFVLSSKPFI